MLHRVYCKGTLYRLYFAGYVGQDYIVEEKYRGYTVQVVLHSLQALLYKVIQYRLYCTGYTVQGILYSFFCTNYIVQDLP